YRILFEMTADTSDLDLEDLFLKQVFGIEEPVLGGACHGVLHRHFPWQLHMKHVAERFGALSRGRLMYGDAMKELMLRFRLTPSFWLPFSRPAPMQRTIFTKSETNSHWTRTNRRF